MTDAQVSQVATEVLRTNLASAATVSQLAVEILRPTAPYGFSAVAGSYTLTGQTSAGTYKRVTIGDAGSFALGGQAATYIRVYIFSAAPGAFTLDGQTATFIRPNAVVADTAVFALTGESAALRADRTISAGAAAFTLSGVSVFLRRGFFVPAAEGTFIIVGGPMVGGGIQGGVGEFTFSGGAAVLSVRPARKIADILSVVDSASVTWLASTSRYDTIALIDRLKAVQHSRFNETVAVTETTSYAFHPGALIDDVISTSELYAPSWKFPKTSIDRVRLAEALTVAYPRTLTDAVTIEDAASVVRGLIVLERLRLLDAPSGDATYYTQLIDTLRAADNLRRFLGGSLNDSWASSDTIALAPQLAKVLTESFALADTTTGKLLLRITAADTFNLDDATPAKWIFNPIITDQIEIAIGYVAPNGGFTTWAVNTRTGAVTEYQNYSFNSFAQIGHKYLGAADSGLYELDGTDDDGTDVIAHIKSGYAQFGGSKYSSFKAAYLGMRGDGDIILKLDTGDGKSYTYQTVIQDMQSTKVRFGKGLRARYFAFELISTGPDFDLDTIEFIPLVAQRRV